jgi:hypothetical protein
MTKTPPLSLEDIAWIKKYSGDVINHFAAEFKEAGDRFQKYQSVLKRFSDTVEKTLETDWSLFTAVDEAHNELCIASALLNNSDPKFSLVEYEPALPCCKKSIDFRVTTVEGLTFYVDIKTIHPRQKDRWEQFEQAQKEKWLPDNVNVIIHKEWLGGEIWHNWFSARSRMLQYTLELEQKIQECKLSGDKVFFILALCGSGFHWQNDHLEDFVSFYNKGFHRSDDAFSQMEEKYIKDSGTKIDRSIKQFACLKRGKGEIQHTRLTWNVQPPKYFLPVDS